MASMSTWAASSAAAARAGAVLLPGVHWLLAVFLILLGGLLALGGVVLILLKLGVIADLWTRPELKDESQGHTLEQSREPSGPPTARHPEA